MTPTISNFKEILDAAQTSDEPLVLYGVGWDDYIGLLDETPEQRYPRFTYFNGVLKIMGKQGTLHENISRFLYDLIRLTSLVLRIKIIPVGSMSLVSKRRSKGADPDESFYIQNADKVTFKNALFNDEKDTPPDLVIEIDETSKSTEKFTIYADFGIREFWRFDKNRLKIYELDEFGSYVEVERSVAFPILSIGILNEFLARRTNGDQFNALLDFEKWLREQTQQQN
jgi:Uma2 family endonuclease